MKIPEDKDTRTRSDWERVIDDWIFNIRDREILKMSMLDGLTYEVIAEKLDMSPRQIARIVPKLQARLFSKI